MLNWKKKKCMCPMLITSTIPEVLLTATINFSNNSGFPVLELNPRRPECKASMPPALPEFSVTGSLEVHILSKFDFIQKFFLLFCLFYP
jgi:hypothetical protein